MLFNITKILLGILLLRASVSMGDLDWISYFVGCFGLICVLGCMEKLIDALNRTLAEMNQSP